MRIDYDQKRGIYKMSLGGNTATANSRMMLIKLACGTVDEETHEDEEDEEDEPEEVY